MKNEFLIWVSFILIGVFIGAIIVYFYSMIKIYSALSEEKYTYLQLLKYHRKSFFFKYIGIVEILKNSKEEKKNEIVELKKKINLLVNEIEGLKNNTEDLNSKNLIEQKNHEPLKDSNIIVWNIEKELKKAITDIFFTIPESDGSFKIVNGKESNEIDCHYRIEIDKSGLTGKLYFFSGQLDRRAIDNIDYYLNPVCDIENINNRGNANKIQMIKPGLVVLRDECWKIDVSNKLKIKLI